jgi:hypothetical protein
LTHETTGMLKGTAGIVLGPVMQIPTELEKRRVAIEHEPLSRGQLNSGRISVICMKDCIRCAVGGWQGHGGRNARRIRLYSRSATLGFNDRIGYAAQGSGIQGELIETLPNLCWNTRPRRSMFLLFGAHIFWSRINR